MIIKLKFLTILRLLLVTLISTLCLGQTALDSNTTVTLKFKEIDFLLKEQIRANRLNLEKSLLLTEISNYNKSLVIKNNTIKNDSVLLFLKDAYIVTKNQQITLLSEQKSVLAKQAKKTKLYLYLTLIISTVSVGYFATNLK